MILPAKLQTMALRAMVDGGLSPDEFEEEDFDKYPRALFLTIRKLVSSGVAAPYADVLLGEAVSEYYGYSPEETMVVRHEIFAQEVVPEQVATLIRHRKQKHVLYSASNELLRQLGSEGEFDVDKVKTLLDTPYSTPVQSESVGDMLWNEDDEEPPSLVLNHFPLLSKVTGGLRGIWAISGAPGAGKSTLAMQIGIHASQYLPVLYYNFELPKGDIRGRIQESLPLSKQGQKQATKHLYLEQDITALDAAIRAHQSQSDHVLIVVDMLQHLPAKVDHKRESLDKWLLTFGQKVLEGHYVIIVSEQSREFYEKPSLSGYKESGGIESRASVGIQLMQSKEVEGQVEVHIVKNRHAPTKGHVMNLQRVAPYWFQEMPRGRF